MSEVQRNTGYAPGLFDASERDSGAIKEKDAKVSYLTKIIERVASDCGESGTIARPLKIVAGLEPERTNAFLQMLAMAATKETSTSTSTSSRIDEPYEDKKKNVSRASAPPPSSFDPFARGLDRDGGKTIQESGPESPIAKIPNAATAGIPQALPSRPLSARRPPPKIKDKREVVSGTGIGGAGASRADLTETSSKNPGAPIEANAGTNAQQSDRIAANAVMRDDDDLDSSDDDGDVVGDVGDGDGFFDHLASNPEVQAWSGSSPERGGALVRDMLRAKRAGDESLAKAKLDRGDTPSTETGVGIILGSRRRRGGAGTGPRGSASDRETVDAETFRDRENAAPAVSNESTDYSSIRASIQGVVRSTNPLGRAMDALAENAESMRNELAFWRRERSKFARRLAEDRADLAGAPRSETSGSVIDEALENTEKDIQSLVAKIRNAKADISANDAMIARLIRMAVAPS